MLAGLNLARALGVLRLIVFTNSKLVSDQLNYVSLTRNKRMVAYKAKVVQAMKSFDKVLIINVLRKENSVADALAVEVSQIHSTLKREAPVEVVKQLCIVSVLT